MHISGASQVFDNTFALVQTFEPGGKTALKTIPNRWISKNFYAVDQHSSKFGNDMVLWPTLKGPEKTNFSAIAISKPTKVPDLTTCEPLRCKVKASKIKSYATVSFHYKL